MFCGASIRAEGVGSRGCSAGDATREKLAAELEPMLPDPPRYQELLTAAKEQATQGHTGARLAVHEFEAIGARVEVSVFFWFSYRLPIRT